MGHAIHDFTAKLRQPAVLPLVWWLAVLSVYALRLPVNYQHGRYVIFVERNDADNLAECREDLGSRVQPMYRGLAHGQQVELFKVEEGTVYGEHQGLLLRRKRNPASIQITRVMVPPMIPERLVPTRGS